MTRSRLWICGAGLVLCIAIPLHTSGAGLGGIRIETPDVSFNPSRIDPFNPNSDVRRGLRDADKRTRKAASALEKSIRNVVRNIENTGSEEAYRAYRDHVISRNLGRGRTLKPDSLHYKIIAPVLGKQIDITKVHLHFGAYVPADMSAITFGNNIYLDDPYRPDDPHQAILLVHEMTHTLQYDRLGGEDAFARRYFGQMWQAIRSGGTNVHCIHDAMGLEKEANAMEDKAGRLVHAGVTIHNNTGLEIHYAVKRHQRGSWKKFTLESGRYLTHSTNFVDALDDFVLFSMRFDHDFASGYQEKAYHLDYNMTFAGDKFDPADGDHYHFAKSGKGIGLFTGKGPSASTNKEILTGTPDPGLNPTFATITLKAGFTPDPLTRTLTAGGTIRTNLGGVNAYVAKAADVRLFYTAGKFPLTIQADSAADTTLLVRLPNGQWMANDDGAGSRNPLIRFNSPQSGRYDIWVGTFERGTPAATLRITERK